MVIALQLWHRYLILVVRSLYFILSFLTELLETSKGERGNQGFALVDEQSCILLDQLFPGSTDFITNWVELFMWGNTK